MIKAKKLHDLNHLKNMMIDDTKRHHKMSDLPNSLTIIKKILLNSNKNKEDDKNYLYRYLKLGDQFKVEELVFDILQKLEFHHL